MSAALYSTASIRRHPIHPMLVPFPIACLVGTLLSDIAYSLTANVMWARFSTWLITIGVILGIVAAVAGAIDFVGNRMIRAQSAAWPHAIGNAVVLILAILNMLIHARDAWTSVVPWGLALSAIIVLILFLVVQTFAQ